jgi:hypothetical protein
MLRAVTPVSRGGCNFVMSIPRAVTRGITSRIRSFSVGGYEADSIAESSRV